MKSANLPLIEIKEEEETQTKDIEMFFTNILVENSPT